MTYSEIASALGLSKGRITQIKSGAPAAECAFFGIGPVAVGVPLRAGVDDRARMYLDAADAATQERIESILATHALASPRFVVTPEHTEPPAGDAIVVCGPKSAPIGANLLAQDPVLGMISGSGRSWIEDHKTGQRHGSPQDDHPPVSGDIAYLARHRQHRRVIVHIAGIHSYGSLGVAHYLGLALTELWTQLGDVSFSMVVRCTLDGLEITAADQLAGPYPW
jgi:hypothetical protein